MPLASDVQAGASVRLSSVLNHTGWDPGIGPERPREPPQSASARRTRPLSRSHSRLGRHDRLKVEVGRKGEDARELAAAAGAIKPKWANGWPQNRRVPPARTGFGSDPRRSEQDAAKEDADTALWAWRRRSPVDIERMMHSQREDRAYHVREAALLGADWPQPRSVDSFGSAAAAPRKQQVVTPGNRKTSWELEYEFHTAAARTAELRQQVAEREAQWDGFVGPTAMEPRVALQVYEQQQVLLHALRKEAEWLRQAAGTEARVAHERTQQPGSGGGFPVDYPGGMAGDAGIAWSPQYGQAWAAASQTDHGLPVQQQYQQQQMSMQQQHHHHQQPYPGGGFGQPQQQYALQQPLQHQPALGSGAYAHSVYT